MLCMPLFIFTSGSSALLGCSRCGLSIRLSLLAILNALFWVYANFSQEKTDKTRKYLKSTIFLWYENGRRWRQNRGSSLTRHSSSPVTTHRDSNAPLTHPTLLQPSNNPSWLQLPSRSWQRRNFQTSSCWEPSVPRTQLRTPADKITCCFSCTAV